MILFYLKNHSKSYEWNIFSAVNILATAEFSAERKVLASEH